MPYQTCRCFYKNSICRKSCTYLAYLFFFSFFGLMSIFPSADFPADPIHLAIHLCRKLLEFFPAEQISAGRAGYSLPFFFTYLMGSTFDAPPYFRIDGIDQIHIIQNDALQFVRIFHPLFFAATSPGTTVLASASASISRILNRKTPAGFTSCF